tara:strand:- start:965 stop:1714 length:750 start_codon:yes stop_codon:yes gene_type:complete
MLTSYLYCPRKFYNQYVLKIKEPPNGPMVKGLIRHMVFDVANKSEKGIILGFKEQDSQDDLEQAFKTLFNTILQDKIKEKKSDLETLNLDSLDVYKELLPKFILEAKTKAKFLFEFASEHKVYGESLWFKLPKPISELRVQSDKLELIGVVDKVEKVGNEFIPIEIKTGRAPDTGIWKGHKIQLAAYILLLSEHYGVPIKEGYVDYKEEGRRKLVMNAFLADEVLDIRDKVKEVLNSKEVPACGCGKCI